MKSTKSLASLLVALIFALIATGTASALTGGSWISGVKIQNLTSGETAQLNVDLYDALGNLKYSINQTSSGQPLIAAAGKSVEVYLPNFSQVAAGQYSAVVSSNVNVGAIVTTTNYPYGMADSYNTMSLIQMFLYPMSITTIIIGAPRYLSKTQLIQLLQEQLHSTNPLRLLLIVILEST